MVDWASKIKLINSRMFCLGRLPWWTGLGYRKKANNIV